MIQAVFAAGVVGRPVSGACVGLEVVVLLQPGPALRSYEIRTQCFARRIFSRV